MSTASMITPGNVIIKNKKSALERKYVVKHEMVGTSRYDATTKTRDNAAGGYRYDAKTGVGEIVTAADLGVDEAGIERLLQVGAIEPLIITTQEYA